MARPKGTKNNMRSPEQKLQILLEYFNSGMNAPLIYKKYNLSASTLRSWRSLYNKGGLNALKSNTGRSTGKFKGRPLKNSNVDALNRQIRDLQIEVARLKKGYLVKGVGQKKEYVTSFNLNTK